MSTLSFVRAWSARRGALVEEVETGTEILVPGELAAALGVPEHARYAEQPAPDAIWVGYGSPVLDRLLQEATRQAAWAALALQPDIAPREVPARAAAERLILRNAVYTLESSLMSTAPRLVAYTRYSLTADDRRDGLIEDTVSVRARTGVPRFWNVARARGELVPARRPSASAELAAAAGAALLRAEVSARAQSRGFLDGFARRQERDRHRIIEYFDGLRAELRKRARRGKLAREDIALKEQAIERERASKLGELEERAAVRFDAELAAVIWVDAPVASLTLRVRRRKAERTLMLEYDVVTTRLVAPVCEACGLDADQPALCDDALHVVCAACVPVADGRWSCPACRRPRLQRGTMALSQS